MLKDGSDADWRVNFRMSHSTFKQSVNLLHSDIVFCLLIPLLSASLCDELHPFIAKQCTSFRTAVSVEKRVALTLYLLAGNEYFRTLSNLFAVGKSTACSISHHVCNVIAANLTPRYIQLATGDRLLQVIARFKQIGHGFPQIGGAIDGSHIPIKAPSHTSDCYYSRK